MRGCILWTFPQPSNEGAAWALGDGHDCLVLTPVRRMGGCGWPGSCLSCSLPHAVEERRALPFHAGRGI